MRRSKWTKQLVVQGALLLATQGVVAYAADAPAPKWYDTIAIGGYVQGSYVGKLNAGPLNKSVQGRQYDTDANSFNLNDVFLQISKPVGDSDHYGFMSKLRVGKDAGVLTATGNDNTSNVFVEEAYVTYAIPMMTKLQLSAGRFLTPEGFEGADTVYNPNFSEGLLFTLAEPVSHTGIKANYTFSDKANATLGLVNGWDVTSDNNDSKTLLWQIATTPTKQISWSFQGLYGNEIATPDVAAPYADHSKRISLDTVLGFNPTDKVSLDLQGNWGQQNHDPITANGTTHWAGVGFWGSLQTTSKFTEIARFEVLNDQEGTRSGGTAQTVKEFTLTHKTMLAANLGTRLEYRHDWSNENFFQAKDGRFVTNQNTISMDWFVTF